MSVNFIPTNQNIIANIKMLGKGVKSPDLKRNYTLYDKNRVKFLALQGKNTFPYLKDYLKNSSDEKGIFEALCVIDKMADNKVENLETMYPFVSKFNNSNSPEIQVILSGIYRKILVPDAFGPLCGILYRQITHPNSKYFDPTEEIGGAILEYLKSYNAINSYKKY